MLSIFLLNLFMKKDRFFFYLHCLVKCEYCALHGTLPYHTFTSDHNLPQKSAIFTPPCFFLLFRDCLARVIFPPSIDNTMQPYSKVEFHDASVIVIAESAENCHVSVGLYFARRVSLCLLKFSLFSLGLAGLAPFSIASDLSCLYIYLV